MRTKSIVIIILYIAGIVMYSCGSKQGGGTHEGETEHEELAEDIVEMSSDQMNIAGIQYGSLEMKNLSVSLRASGVITSSPQNVASVCSPLGGFVKSTSVIQGAAVKKGQLLAILENVEFIDLQQQYLEASSKLEYAEADYKRHDELARENVYSAKNLQQVTSEFKSLKAQVNALAQKLSLIGISPSTVRVDKITPAVAITAPISGYIKSAHINVGKSLSPADVMFEIVNTDKLLLELTLFEKDINKVSPGQTLHFSLNNEEEDHKAVVYQAGKTLSDERSFTVYAEVIQPCKNVLPGMFVSATISSEGQEVTALPSEAVVHFDDKDYIFLHEKDKTENGKPFTEFRMVEIRKGLTEGGYSEVILPEGIKAVPGKIVLKGAYRLLSAKKNAGEMSCG
jgi:cobalt-zinc-cadmium efflux system membrane fusion protein